MTIFSSVGFQNFDTSSGVLGLVVPPPEQHGLGVAGRHTVRLERLGSASTLVLSLHLALPAEPVHGVELPDPATWTDGQDGLDESRSIVDRYNITSDQDLKDARDRRAQFGHNPGGKVISIAR